MAEPKVAPSLMLGVDELAQALGISRTTLYQLRASGRLPLPQRLSRRPLWLRSEIEAWARAGCPTLENWQTVRGE
jgi:excisionase family DNA binding protein